MIPGRIAIAVLLGSAAALATADDKGDRRAAVDYMLHCSGCHGMDGSGAPARGIPDFREQVGHFQRLPEGRAFLLQVPGLLNAGLPDDRRAAVTSWLVRRFAGPSLPPDFQPYTAAEAREYRESRPADISATRKRLYEELLAAGYAVR
jgi:mono/diheme cytochrome c family protein